MQGELHALPGQSNRLVSSFTVVCLSACLLADPVAAQGPSDPSGSPVSATKSDSVAGGSLSMATIRVPQGERIVLPITNASTQNRNFRSIYMVGLPPGAMVSDNIHDATITSESRTLDVSNWNIEGISLLLPDDIASRFPDPIVTSIVAILPRSEKAGSIRTETLSTTVIIPEIKATKSPETVSTQPSAQPDNPPPPALTPQPASQPTPKDDKPETPWLDPKSAEGKPKPDNTGEPTSAQLKQAPSTAEKTRDTAQDQATASSQTPDTAAQAGPTTARDAGESALAKSLTQRAQQALRLGNVSGARLLLQRAASSGDAEATFMLAQTYDESFLRHLGVRGLKADPEQARTYYDAAARAGYAGIQRQAKSGR